jgi:hypothetical protein
VAQQSRGKIPWGIILAIALFVIVAALLIVTKSL